MSIESITNVQCMQNLKVLDRKLETYLNLKLRETKF